MADIKLDATARDRCSSVTRGHPCVWVRPGQRRAAMTAAANARGRARGYMHAIEHGGWSTVSNKHKGARQSTTTMTTSAINGNGPVLERDAMRVRGARARARVAETRWRMGRLNYVSRINFQSGERMTGAVLDYCIVIASRSRIFTCTYRRGSRTHASTQLNSLLGERWRKVVCGIPTSDATVPISSNPLCDCPPPPGGNHEKMFRSNSRCI